MKIEEIWKPYIQDEFSLRTKTRNDTFIFAWQEELDLLDQNGYDLFFINKSNSGKNYTLRVAFRDENRFNLKTLSKKCLQGNSHSFRKIGKYELYAGNNWAFDGDSGEYIMRLGSNKEKAIMKAQSFLIENKIPPYIYLVDDVYSEDYNTPEGLEFEEFWNKIT